MIEKHYRRWRVYWWFSTWYTFGATAGHWVIRNRFMTFFSAWWLIVSIWGLWDTTKQIKKTKQEYDYE